MNEKSNIEFIWYFVWQWKFLIQLTKKSNPDENHVNMFREMQCEQNLNWIHSQNVISNFTERNCLKKSESDFIHMYVVKRVHVWVHVWISVVSKVLVFQRLF